MRTIDPILKTACQTGSGLPIASAVIHSLATPPLADQNFTAVKYEIHSEELTAVIRGSEVPNYGTIVISRGYQVGGTEYTEALPPCHISKVVEITEDEYEITASAYPTIPVDLASGATMATWMTDFANLYYLSIAIPESGQPNSIFDATISVAVGEYNNVKQGFYGVGPWPLVRFYLTETGVRAISVLSDTANITSISIITSREIRFYNFISRIYDYGPNLDLLPYLNDTSRLFDQSIDLHYTPVGLTPDLLTTVAKYYNERDNARTFFLLADMELEEGDLFEYDGYTWRIETISEKYGREFTQSLFCLRIIPPDYLLLEIGDNILLESGDDLLME